MDTKRGYQQRVISLGRKNAVLEQALEVIAGRRAGTDEQAALSNCEIAARALDVVEQET